MSLPSNWVETPLGEIVFPDRPRHLPSETPDLPFIGMENVETHSMKLLGTVTAGSMKSSAVHFMPGDVLYGRLRPYLNKVLKAAIEGLCSAEFIVFSDHGYVNPSWLAYRLNSSDFVSFAAHLNEGDRPRVDLDQISLFSINLPPQAEQDRIVAEIEKQFTRLDDAVVGLKRVQANLKRYRASVLKAACEGTLFSPKREYEPQPISEAIASLDQGWSPQCVRESSENPKDWAIIKTTAVQPLHFLSAENKLLPVALEPRPQLQIKGGDLLVTRAGPRSRVGIVCLVRHARPRLMLCDKVYRLRSKPKRAIPEYLEIVLNAPGIADALDALKSGISDSGVNLTQGRFGELVIPLPPIDEQEAIVDAVEKRISVVNHIEAAVRLRLDAARVLRQAILRDAFQGKLVPQNPDDEPASLLLKRIRAERASDATQKNGTHRSTKKPLSAHNQRRRRVAKLAQRVNAGKG